MENSNMILTVNGHPVLSVILKIKMYKNQKSMNFFTNA